MDKQEVDKLIIQKKGETLAQAAAREQAEKKEAYRSQFVREMFELWVGRPMFDEEYTKYIDIFDSPLCEKGYNLKTFIKSEGLKVLPEHRYKHMEWERYNGKQN